MQGGTDWEVQAYSCKEEELQWEERKIFSLPLKHTGSIQQSSQSGLEHRIFVSQCLWEPEDAISQEARQQLETAGSHKCLSVIYQLLALPKVIQKLLCLWP